MQQISGVDDPRIADYREVADPALVRARGLFVAEGRMVLRRLIAERRYRIRSVLLNDAAARSLERAISALDGDVPVYVGTNEDFRGIASYNIHRGCLALAERPAPLSLDEVIGKTDRVVILEGVANPDNVGAVFRNAAALGAGGVLLDPESCDPFYRKAIRTSMAASLHVPFARLEPWPDALATVRDRGFTLVAFTPSPDAEDLERFAARRDRPARMALLVGSEGEGLSAEALARADVTVRIAIAAAVDSLNLATAAAIALYRLRPASL